MLPALAWARLPCALTVIAIGAGAMTVSLANE
jgi:H+/gluconate symporter-like permease